ncbi:hypothetical protein AWC15_08655 [Mycobacterium lacus]|uniref:Exported repetitive protein n=2 Tax=Mycobacterium lacus TaxID=169765 RepID=A0A1X1XNV7_9MYCO|nr:hypothetical protein AWC15_08655 [Mycobacterium lacus]BBX99122.1 Exported repetitive protein [Mycobacterium lacus]
MSAVAALAVASPCAYFLVYESTSGTNPPEHHEFKQAANVADLPSELIGALSQGLSQFGINLPPVPALTGTGTTTPGLGSPGLGSPGLTSPGLGTSGLTNPDPTNPGLTSPGLTNPGLTSPGLTSPSPGLTPTTPGSLAAPGAALTPTQGAAVNPALPNPALTSPAGVTPGLTSPAGLSPTGAGPNEVPIGLDPGADGTYPILGDTSGLGGMPVSSPASTGGSGGGGLVNDLMQAANQLGAAQAIDLIKGLIMPAIMQGVQNGAAAAPAAGAPAAAIPADAAPAIPAPAAAAAAAPAALAPAATPPPV